MRRFDTILFDLDGTLTNPAQGITRCIQVALEGLGRPSPSREALEKYIGPAIQKVFAELLQTEDAGLIEEAVRRYRERFGTVGLFENELYPGVPEMLAQLKQAGMTLCLATSKPLIYATRILEHFQLDRFIDRPYGSQLDGTLSDKTQLIAHILAAEGVGAERRAMVGDRKYDMLGATANGMYPVGVLYGFGSADELREAGAQALCTTPEDVVSTLAP